jgi:RNase adaptor protein for sRNA GlmZ degradation
MAARERDRLTQEVLRGLFKNNFELANYAIHLGQYYIKAGHEVNADNLLEQVRKHPNPQYLKDLKQIDAEEAEDA